MLHTKNRLIAAVSVAITAVMALSVPVMAEIARLEQLPLGSGSATISWTGKTGVTPTISSISGKARGLAIFATGRVPKPPSLAQSSTGSTPVSLPASYPIANIKGAIGGTSFTLAVAINLTSLNLNSNTSAAMGTVTGSFRGQAIRAVLSANNASPVVAFSGTIGADHITGTIGRVIRHGTKSTATAHFDITR
jgi:hypothetical protein